MRTLDRLYKLYREGRVNNKAPQSYIDYFKVSKFVLDELDNVEKEVIAMLRYSKHNPPVDCECDTCLNVIPEIEKIFRKLKGKNYANNL